MTAHTTADQNSTCAAVITMVLHVALLTSSVMAAHTTADQNSTCANGKKIAAGILLNVFLNKK